MQPCARKTRVPSFRSIDSLAPIERQPQVPGRPVVLVDLFHVAEADIPALMAGWEKDANRMRRQPGFVSTQLHRAIDGRRMFMNCAACETADRFRAAFTHPEFVGALGAYPSSAVATPHLLSKVAVANLCAA